MAQKSSKLKKKEVKHKQLEDYSIRGTECEQILANTHLYGFVEYLKEQPALVGVLNEVRSGFRVADMSLSELNPEAYRACADQKESFFRWNEVPDTAEGRRELAMELERCKFALFPYSVGRVHRMPNHSAARVFALYGDVRDPHTMASMKEFVVRVAGAATGKIIPPEKRVQEIPLREFRNGVGVRLFSVVKSTTRIVLSVIDSKEDMHNKRNEMNTMWGRKNQWRDLSTYNFFRYRRPDVAHVVWKDEDGEWHEKPMRWVHVILTNDPECMEDVSDPKKVVVMQYPWSKKGTAPIVPPLMAIKKAVQESKRFERINTMDELRGQIAETKEVYAQLQEEVPTNSCLVCREGNEEYDAEVEMSPLYRKGAVGKYVEGLLCSGCRDEHCRGDCEYCGIQLTKFKTPHYYATVMPKGMQIDSDLKSCMRCWKERVPEDFI